MIALNLQIKSRSLWTFDYKYSIVWIYHSYLSIHQSMDIGVASSFWLLWIKPIQILLYKSLFSHFFLHECPQRELLGHVINVCLGNSQMVFRNSYTILLFYQQCMRFPTAPDPCHYLMLSVLSILAILVGVVVYHYGFNLYFPEDVCYWNNIF